MTRWDEHLPSAIDPYRGPTEDEALAAAGTSREEIERLADALGMPSGFEDEPDGWLDGSSGVVISQERSTPNSYRGRMHKNVEFIDWADSTGDASRGAICQVWDGDEVIFTVVVRLSRTLMRTSDLTIEDIDRLLPVRAERLIVQRGTADPSWVLQHHGDRNVVWTLTTAERDLWEAAS